MRTIARVAAALLVAALVAALPTAAPRARAAEAAEPPIAVQGVDYRYRTVDGVRRLERLVAGLWQEVAPVPAATGRITPFGGTLYLQGEQAGATGGSLYRLDAGRFVASPTAPAGVLDAFVFRNALYAVTRTGWAVSTDGATWSAVAGAPAAAANPVEYAGGLYVEGADPTDPSGADRLYRFDGAAFTAVAGAPTGMDSPVVSGGTLYFRDAWAGLWSYDGTTFLALNDGTYYPIVLGPVVLNGHLYVGHVSRQDQWSVDRVEPDQFVQVAEPSSLTGLVSVDGAVWYQSPDPTTGAPVWRTWREPLVPGTVTVAGTVSLGATLTAQPKGWPAGTTFTYAWRRNGIAIPAATTSRYRLVPDDDYATLSVRVVATVSGYDRTSATATAFVAGVLRPAPFASHPAAVIHGTMRSGSFAYAAVAPWTPAVSRLTYQWRRDGRNIDGADRRTYWLKGTDRGHLISAVVVGSRDGYVTTIVHGAARRVS